MKGTSKETPPKSNPDFWRKEDIALISDTWSLQRNYSVLAGEHFEPIKKFGLNRPFGDVIGQ